MLELYIASATPVVEAESPIKAGMNAIVLTVGSSLNSAIPLTEEKENYWLFFYSFFKIVTSKTSSYQLSDTGECLARKQIDNLAENQN